LSTRNFRRESRPSGDSEGPSDAVSVRNVMPAPACQPNAGDRQKVSRVSGKPPRKSAVRALGKTVRLSDKKHRKFVSRQPCLVCGRTPSDPHHLTFMQPRALGHRVSDEFTVPVCRIHHRELHRQGDEVAWWGKFSIDPLPVALRLWQHTRLNGDELAPSESMIPSRATKPTDMSAQMIDSMGRSIGMSMQRAPFLKTASRTRAGEGDEVAWCGKFSIDPSSRAQALAAHAAHENIWRCRLDDLADSNRVAMRNAFQDRPAFGVFRPVRF
jgi:hypothetical protein